MTPCLARMAWIAGFVLIQCSCASGRLDSPDRLSPDEVKVSFVYDASSGIASTSIKNVASRMIRIVSVHPTQKPEPSFPDRAGLKRMGNIYFDNETEYKTALLVFPSKQISINLGHPRAWGQLLLAPGGGVVLENGLSVHQFQDRSRTLCSMTIRVAPLDQALAVSEDVIELDTNEMAVSAIK